MVLAVADLASASRSQRRCKSAACYFLPLADLTAVSACDAEVEHASIWSIGSGEGSMIDAQPSSTALARLRTATIRRRQAPLIPSPAPKSAAMLVVRRTSDRAQKVQVISPAK